MTGVGIAEIGVAIPRHFISVGELARARGMAPGKAIKGLQVLQASISFQTTVIELAANAVQKIRYDDVVRFYFAAESNPDASKPEIWWRSSASF